LSDGTRGGLSDGGWGRNDGWDSKVDRHAGNYGDGGSGIKNNHDDSDLWASRIVSYVHISVII